MVNYKYEKTYNEIIGITKDHRVVILDHIFEYSDKFKGATRYEMRPLTQAEIDEANDVELASVYAEDLWQIEVANGQTKLGLEEYTQDLIEQAQSDGLYFLGDDPSFRHDTDEAFDKLTDEQKKAFVKVLGEKGIDFMDWSSDCCGRIGDDYKNWDWEILFRPDLLEEIAKYEG